MNKKKWLFAFLLAAVSHAAGRDWRWDTRVDLSAGMDNNVMESVSDRLSDITGRLQFHLGGTGKFKPSILSFQYRGGCEIYSRYSAENRVLNDFQGRFEIPVVFRSFAGLSMQARDKTFFNDNRGYRSFQASPFLGWSFGWGLKATCFATFAWLNYKDGTVFDYEYMSGGLTFDFMISPKFIWDVQIEAGTMRFNRQVLSFESFDFQPYTWIYNNDQQKDNVQEISAGLELYQWVLIHGRIFYQTCRSNSYGYSYSMPGIMLIAAKALPWNMTLRLYWNLQLKRYTDSLQPILQMYPDSEHEENNYFLVDFSKDLSAKTSLRMRFGMYRNESPFRDRYYRKNLISLGFTQRL